MPFDARLWFLILTPILLTAGCFISAEDRARGFDPDRDGLPWPLDCDNTQAEIGGEEIPYDGLDNDCDAETPDDDLDLDGRMAADDCDDLDPTQGGEEVCDGRDNDCDGLFDDYDPGLSDGDTWYADYDGDGDGDPDSMVRSCTRPADHVDNLDDCDDFDEDVQIGAPEVCSDYVDQDCDGKIDGLGEMCDPGVPCTQGAACTSYNYGDDQICGCSCPDQGSISWDIIPICFAGDCQLDYTPATIGGIVFSCPQELLESIYLLTPFDEIVFTINCDERDISALLRWYAESPDDSTTLYAFLDYSTMNEGTVDRLRFGSAYIERVSGRDVDPYDQTCSGIAELTFRYEDVDF